MKTNCPNCGAPIDEEKHKCSYCGTPYFDMSFMNFDDNKPFYLKIKYGDVYITQLVRPQLGDIMLESDYQIAYGKYNTPLYQFETNKTLTTSISFKAIPDENKALYTLEKVDS